MIEAVRIGENAIEANLATGYKIDTNYYNQHKEEIDRFSSRMGKTSYDIPQLEIVGDIFSGAKNTAKSVYYSWLRAAYKAATGETQPIDFIRRAEENHIKYKNLTDDIREEYRRKIEIEPNATQRFTASMAAESLRVVTDLRQLPALVGTSLFSPVVAGYIGATTTIGKIGTAMVLNGFENLVEDNVDTYFTDNRFQTLEENIYSFGGGAGGALIFQGLGYGVKAGINAASKKLDSMANRKVTRELALNIFKDASKKIDAESAINKGDTTVRDYNNITKTVDNLKEINDIKGTAGSEQAVIDKHLYVNEVSSAEAKNRAGIIMQKVISDPEIDFIKNGTDFTNYISKDEKGFVALIKAVRDKGMLTEKEAEAFDYFLDMFDSKKITDIRFDTQGAVDEINSNINSIINSYNPIFEDERTQLFRVDEETFINNRTKIKHNYKDFPKGTLITRLEKEGIIPSGAKVNFVRGNIDKIPYTVKSNLNADRNPVYIKKKWLKGDERIQFEYELNGKKYYGELTLTKDHGYLGNIYELDTKATKGTKENITPKKPIKNIVDDMNGTPEPIKPATEADLVSMVSKSLGLDKKYNSKLGLEDSVLKIQKRVGEIVRKKYNVNSIEDMINSYQIGYDIDFSYKGKKTMDSLGETRIINKDGRRVVEVYLSDKINDLDTELGVMRHEIQHIIDLYQNPDFKSKAFSYIDGMEDSTIEEVLNKVGSGHFAGFDDTYFEISYILRNQMDNLVRDGKIDDEVAEILKLEIPKNADSLDAKVTESIVKGAMAENDPAVAIAKLRKELSTYTKWKKDLYDIFFNANTTAEATTNVGEWLETNLFIPFEKVDQQMKGMILGLMEIEDKMGSILSPKELCDTFDKGGLARYLFRWDSKLPDNLKYLEPKLLETKKEFYKIMKDLTQGSELTPEDIINNFMFDQGLSVEKYLQKEELVKFLDENKNLDLGKLIRGKMSFDDVTGIEIPERLRNIRDRFAEENLEFFRSAPEVLEAKLKSKKKMSKSEILKELERVRNCMSKDDKINLIKKYKLDEVEGVNNYIEKSNFYEDIDSNKIAENILESKKRNAKYMYSMDLMSKRGDIKYNHYLGTHLNRFGRFERYLNEDMLISKDSLRKLVDKNSTGDRNAIHKFINEISAAKAMQEVLPNGGYNTVKHILDRLQEFGANADFQTYARDIEGKMKERIGMRLGVVTKPPKQFLDKAVINLLSLSNKVSLTGFKAFKDFAFEAPTIARASTMLYGRSGIVDTIKQFMKAAQVLHLSKEMYDKVDKAMGKRFENSVLIKFISSVMDSADDYVGLRHERMMKYGSKAEKAMSSVDNGLNKLNLYGETQKIMKLASFFIASETLRDIGKYTDIDDLFKHNTNYMKRLFDNVGINDLDYHFIKKLDTIQSFREGIFSEVDVFDMITKTDMEKKLGRVLADEEFELMKKSVSDKIVKLYDKIATDVSPTEANPSMRAAIENIRNPVHRNFMRLMGNFKTSINEQWRRLGRDFYLSNMNDGKFDWGNKIWQKRLFKHLAALPVFYGGIALISDPEFYADPVATINDKVDELIDNPGSNFWNLVDTQINTWALVNGAAAVRRPITISQNLLKGDIDKAFVNMMKLGIGTSNFNLATGAYEKFQDIEDEF